MDFMVQWEKEADRTGRGNFMNQQQLVSIRHIASMGSIREAAVLLGRNPSTLTRGLKSVENELGCQLFRRIRGGMVPTPEGETVLSWGEKIAESLEKLPGDRQWSENEIRYLLCIRENESICGAAETLFIAQPSLSQVLKEIENDLDFEIFKRDRSGAMETEQGRLFLDQLEEVWKLWKAMKDELGEFKELKKGTVTIGIPMNLGSCILPVVVPVFHKHYPGVNVFIRENNSQELEKMMLSHKVDFCIMHFQKALEKVCYDEFSEDPFYLAVPESFQAQVSWPEGKPLNAEDVRQLKNIPFVMVASRQKLRQVADEILGKAGIRPQICWTTKSMETAKRLAAGGMGATFLPKSYMTLYSGTDGLNCYPLDEELGASWKLVAAYPADEKLSRVSREFLRVLRECLE